MMGEAIYLVTGAAGHLGSTIVRMLVRRGETVRALVLPDDPCNALQGLTITLFRGNLCVPASLPPLFQETGGRPLIVIHAAGMVSITSRVDSAVEAVNVGGTKALLELCFRYRVARFVYVSSVHAIPETPGVIRETSRFSPAFVHGHYAKTRPPQPAPFWMPQQQGWMHAWFIPPASLGLGIGAMRI